MPARTFEVWGDPIDHSLSPRLHTAAYAELGRDWSYGRRRVDEGGFAAALAGVDATCGGLSLTMPLKGLAFRAATGVDDRAARTRAVNTLVREDDIWHGFNTDVGGIVGALGEAGIGSIGRGRIVGAGATATSALVALVELGAHEVEITARRADAVAALIALGEDLGIRVTGAELVVRRPDPRELTIATLPGGAAVASGVADALADAGGALLDVVYGHWPTALSAAWARRGLPVQDGSAMLVHQALLQVRAFGAGRVDEPLADEPRLLAVMRGALVGD